MPRKLIDALTDAHVRSAKVRERDYKLTDGRGLYLLVKANGSRHWRFKYSYGGRERLLALGEYPDVSLSRAREKAGQARELIREGFDPVQKKRADKAARVSAALNTFRIVAERWIPEAEIAKKWTPGHTEQTRQSLKDYVLPKLGERPVSSITAADVAAVLAPLQQAGKLETMRRVRQRLRTILAYAVQHGLRPDNPALHTQGGLYIAPQRVHFASIKPDEIQAFLEALNGYKGSLATKTLIRMILWTAARTGELRGAKAEEFDLKAGVWRIPAERMKKRRIHVVPLPRQAVEAMRELLKVNAEAEYVFALPERPLQMPSENIVLQALEKMGYKGRLTGHGLRAAVATALEEKGFDNELIKAQLSHAKANLTDAAYLRGVHLERRRAMMQQWADELDGLPAENVLPLRAAG